MYICPFLFCPGSLAEEEELTVLQSLTIESLTAALGPSHISFLDADVIYKPMRYFFNCRVFMICFNDLV